MDNLRILAGVFLTLSVLIGVLGVVSGEIVIVVIAVIAGDAAAAVLLARRDRGEP